MNVGKELTEFLKNKACQPYSVMHAFMNNKRMGGFHLVDIYLTSNGRLGLIRKKNKKITNQKDIALLGQGAEGIAMVGCIDNECKKMVVIKSAKSGLKLEYRILMKIFKFSPHIITPYMFVNCSIEEMLYQEYANGGDLFSIITKYHSVIKPIHMKTIIFQVIVTLMIVQKKAPSFKHNDMHLRNVLVDLNFKTTGSIKYDTFFVPNIGIRAVINDYGFAHMTSVPNPKVTSKQYANDYGIAPDSHRMYDVHFFLNALYTEVSRFAEFADVANFITSIIPHKYLVMTSPVIMNSRLRYGISHPDFPTFSRILYNGYFSEFHKSRANFTNSVNMTSPPKVNVNKVVFKLPRPKQPSPPKVKPKSPSPPKAKPKSPSPNKPKVSDACGDKSKPTTGIGAQKLTTQQMGDLIKRRGHKVPKGQPTRQELCAIIMEHGLVVTPNTSTPTPKPKPKPRVKPPPAPVSFPKPEYINNKLNAVPFEAEKIKNFIASQNVVVEKPKPVAVVVEAEKPKAKPAAAAGPVAVQFLSNKKLWNLHTKKITDEIYDTMPKEGNYQNRMDEARGKAVKVIKNMKNRGEAAPQYYKK